MNRSSERMRPGLRLVGLAGLVVWGCTFVAARHPNPWPDRPPLGVLWLPSGTGWILPLAFFVSFLCIAWLMKQKERGFVVWLLVALHLVAPAMFLAAFISLWTD